ncbi:flagellin [Sulfurimonas sp.]|uniref:flagellin N-terminal helical domain-containing protein n=1 Tax=Sulfurimonas sp. TaxID=2022749 RepID=UPI0026139EAB|nr:flagellin [Sulfurimonas sp.]MDD5157099.1 flagellin [Sulfurimonas sp.]
MRVTSSMYYKNINTESSRANERLFDVNKQIASGLKIQHASDDVNVFSNTMRLDNEITALGQIKKSTESGSKIANQTDTTLNDFEDSLSQMKSLLNRAATGTNSNASLDAIAKELRGLESHLKNLSNTSINGQYIFSGSATDTKPISDNGIYNGNSASMKSFLGSNVQQQYNISGSELFLGEEILTKKEITTNVPQYSLSAKYPDFTDKTKTGTDEVITANSKIRDLMGDVDNDIDSTNAKHHFYISGIKSSGESFSQQISMRDDESMQSLLDGIGKAYGNTPSLSVVNVSLNSLGEIVIEDKLKGSSKLDFHMVGATDLSRDAFHDGGDVGDGMYGANIGKIDNLDGGETDFNKIIYGVSTASNPKLFVKEFVKSDLSPASGAASNIGGLLYDRTQFEKNGAKLSSNVSQIVKGSNAFASPSTKISEVADISKGTTTTDDDTLNFTQLKLAGKDVYGSAFNVQIDLRDTVNGGSTFSLDGGNTNYSIYNTQTPRTAINADDMTYKQLMDVVNMVATGNIPSLANDITAYDSAIENASLIGNTKLSYDGKIEFEDINSTNTKASISMFDSNSGNFNINNDGNGDGTTDKTTSSAFTFNSNSALVIRDSKTDFFQSIDKIIKAVESYDIQPDALNGDKKNIGIQNALKLVDDLSNHIYGVHSKIGAQSNALAKALDRTSTLEISTMTLRSSFIDTDQAESYLKLTQLSNNYQAMLSTVAKISKLSLVNYL